MFVGNEEVPVKTFACVVTVATCYVGDDFQTITRMRFNRGVLLKKGHCLSISTPDVSRLRSYA
jgi:hypothetical protein